MKNTESMKEVFTFDKKKKNNRWKLKRQITVNAEL